MNTSSNTYLSRSPKLNFERSKRSRVSSCSALGLSVLLTCAPSARASVVSYAIDGEIPFSLSSGFEHFGNTSFTGTISYETLSVLPTSFDPNYSAATVAELSLQFSNGLSVTRTINLGLDAPWTSTLNLLTTRGTPSINGNVIQGFQGETQVPFIGTPNPNNVLLGGFSLQIPTSNSFSSLNSGPLLDIQNINGQIGLYNDQTSSGISLRNINVAPIPEPSHTLLLGLGFIGLAGVRRRRAKS